jgi:hypothetical protein
MAILKAFPGATWVGSKRAGKPWVGTTAPMMVIHTLEFNAWPDPDRWDAPAHLVCNPNTGEVHQYLPMDKAAYAVRDNALEDDEPTFQVELWGKAANVPGYSAEWYEGVANLCNVFVDEYGIPPIFADFSRVAVAYPGATPDRMTHAESDAFTGFLGHCHMGLGTDTHWDPGRLDTDKVLAYMTGDDDVSAWYDWVAGWVTGLDEDHVRKLHTAGIITGDVDYWIDLLDNPNDPAWRYFYPRAQASTWAKIGDI